MPTLYSPDDLKEWDNASLDPRAYSLMLSHLFGSARMGPDTRDSVVGLDFQVHGLRGRTSIADRVEWDNFYIQNWSLRLDLRIIAMTIAEVLRYREDA